MEVHSRFEPGGLKCFTRRGEPAPSGDHVSPVGSQVGENGFPFAGEAFIQRVVHPAGTIERPEGVECVGFRVDALDGLGGIGCREKRRGT